MILLADANVLIDLYLVDGLGLLAQIAPAEVLDFVLEEVDCDDQPGIKQKISESKIQIVPAEKSWTTHVTETGLSIQD